MSKVIKISLIVFVIGIVGLGVTMGVIIGFGIFEEKDNEEVIRLSEDVKGIALSIDKADVDLVESDEMKIVLRLNLWADKDIKAGNVAVVSEEQGILAITEIPPQNNFFGIFSQPYELKITINAPKSMIDDIDWRNRA